ncbi:acyl carrier protein 2 [Firmicutes bacterium CAG:212]|nr:acyl carrier protein 2 [Firmicutes bacterium CAG:212]
MEFEKIQKIIAEEMNLNVEDIKPESRFVEDLAADSLDVIQIVLKLEEEFDIEIPDDAVEQISTVQDAVDQIKSKKNA